MRIVCCLVNLSVLVGEFGAHVCSSGLSYILNPVEADLSDMEESAARPGCPEFDVYGAMDWTDGVGTLPGSELKFRVNEFGVLEVITEDAEPEGIKKAHATTTWAIPTAQEAFSASTPGKEGGPELPWAKPGLVCVRCHRKGSSVDFLADGRHCSERCLRQDQQEEKDTGSTNGEAVSVGRKRCLASRGIAAEEMEMAADVQDDDEDYEEKADRKTARGPNRGRRKRRGDADLLKHTVPYGGKRKVWCWASYLERMKATAAPSKLFKEHQSFPQNKNSFRVGMKLEGVDPEHPSMYCVLTVAEVSGHRIRLHFDKYSDCYDFWVYSNSPDIHPVGWCEKTGHKLNSPKGTKEEEFSWPSYIKLCKAQAAPKALFENQNTTVTPSGFRIGMKLEAVNKKTPSLICVATVTDMVDSRFLVHFDNWDESYDYWCDATSPYIHPVNWCQKNGKLLTTPPGYQNAKGFSWERYLEDTNSLPAPARAFKAKPPHSFQKAMKLEAVDRRNTMLIRVVTVVDTEDHRIKVHFDGWTDEYDYWVDADSPDIHPAGWCAKTGHPLQPPICPQELQSVCPTPGCKGMGHIKGARYSGHHSAVGCPYSDININKDSVLPDRLSGEMPGSSSVAARPRRADGSPDMAGGVTDKPQAPSEAKDPEVAVSEPAPKKPITSEPKRRVGRPCKQRKVEEVQEEEEVESEVSSIMETKELTLQQALHQSVFMPCASPAPNVPLCWDKHSKLLPTVAGITASKVAEWTVEQVTQFIQGLPGCKEHVRTFKEEQIDGEAFLLLTQVDLVKIMCIKLGPALKIYNSILMFKTAEDSYNEL
ncbi:lethal(3)malignant brain tumor-like protein 3 isoform X1 [Brienomyrus brachyistius]|uniref:lethal(3)malignant brain tumor-like protein 3 isoform X1 n=2 Tax=Brienomyrus brachyistius TaxID=42636 RepID=UPI0020B202C2|nr:lethal(3)malignant brain tumor-like protein 3 isoform X1 [Brienomyrus brachyistius]